MRQIPRVFVWHLEINNYENKLHDTYLFQISSSRSEEQHEIDTFSYNMFIAYWWINLKTVVYFLFSENYITIYYFSLIIYCSDSSTNTIKCIPKTHSDCIAENKSPKIGRFFNFQWVFVVKMWCFFVAYLWLCSFGVCIWLSERVRM